MPRRYYIPPPVRSLAADGNHHCLFLGVDSFPRVQASSRAFGYNCTGSRQRYRRGQSTFDGRFRSGGCSLRCVGVEEIASDVLCLLQSAFVLRVVFISSVLENFSEDECTYKNGFVSGFSSVRYYRYRCRGDAAFVSRFSRSNRILLDVCCRFWRSIAAFRMGRGEKLDARNFSRSTTCGDECFSCVCDCCPGFRSTRSLHYISY